MPLSNEEQRFIAFAKQSAYGTMATLNTSGARNYNQITPDDKNMVEYEANKLNNKEWANGSEFPTKAWFGKWMTKVSRKMPLDAHTIGHFLRLLLGVPVTSTVASEVFSHVFTPQNPATSRQLKAFSLLEWDYASSDTHDNLFRDMMVNSMELGGDNQADIIRFDMEWIGSGKRVSPSTLVKAPTSGYNVEPVSNSLPFLYNQMASVEVAGDNYACDLDKWSWKWNNNHDVEGAYRAACGAFQASNNNLSGIVATQMLFGKRSSMFEVVLQDQNSVGWWDTVEANALVTMLVTIGGPAIEGSGESYLLSIQSDNVDLSAAKRGTNGNGFHTLALNLDVFANTSGDILTVTLINDVSSYA